MIWFSETFKIKPGQINRDRREIKMKLKENVYN